MNCFIINTKPKEYVKINVAHSVQMKVLNLNFGISVEVNCLTLDENNNVFRVDDVVISGDDYNNWGNDDMYLIKCVLSKLGLEISE